jgi:hypothetical protein
VVCRRYLGIATVYCHSRRPNWLALPLCLFLGSIIRGEESSPKVSAGKASGDSPAVVGLFETYDGAYQYAEQHKGWLVVVFGAEKPTPDGETVSPRGGSEKPNPIGWVPEHRVSQALRELKISLEEAGPVAIAWLSPSATTKSGGRVVRLLDHPAFAQLNHGLGVAVISFRNPENPLVEQVVRSTVNQKAFDRLIGEVSQCLRMESAGDRESRYTQEVSETQEVARTPLTALEAQPKELPSRTSRPPVFRTYHPPICNLEPLPVPIQWYDNYAAAYDRAAKERRPLLIYFRDDHPTSPCREFDLVLDTPTVQEFLRYYVCARLPLSARTVSDGKEIPLLEHSAFSEMLGLPGLAIVDLAHTGADYYGTVVSVFPFLRGQLYTHEQVLIILTLPPGTLTQRTLIYAVRSHPERPRSADGVFDPYLAAEASSHASYQARIGLQGHHFWESRFHKILSRLPFGLVPQEVCAESWPGQGLLESAIECVRCWRLSEGHWSAVARYHPYFGYDMKRGANGVWYATGIFAKGGLLR